MSLVFTLASRNLFQDRLRFVAALVGIVFSVVLIMAQIGLYVGFSRMVTTMIATKRLARHGRSPATTIAGLHVVHILIDEWS